MPLEEHQEEVMEFWLITCTNKNQSNNQTDGQTKKHTKGKLNRHQEEVMEFWLIVCKQPDKQTKIKPIKQANRPAN